MYASHDETITRLEDILRELECEFLYLINDMQSERAQAGRPPDLRLPRLELARHCVSAAVEALGREEAPELV